VRPLDGGAVRDWLTRESWRKAQKAPSGSVLDAAMRVLEATARYDGPEDQVHLRCAWDGSDTLYYDLADADWRTVKISREGWEVTSSSPVRFRRFAPTGAQVTPEHGGDLKALWSLVNARSDRDRRLIDAWSVTALVPDIPRPILAFHGDQGGGKTTAARILASLIDPSSAPLLRARDEVELVQGLAHRYVAILDNLSFISESLSDLLSRAVTGAGFTNRRL
jgi:hypothetical protein